MCLKNERLLIINNVKKASADWVLKPWGGSKLR